MNENANTVLGEAPIGRLIFRFSIPSILSLLIAALYNMVDQIFIGRGVGYLGNGATNVVYPATVIALALSIMVGNGCAAYLSICQGRNDHESSHKSVGNGIAVTAMRLYLSGIAFYCVQRGCAIFLQSLGKPMLSAALSLLRGIYCSTFPSHSCSLSVSGLRGLCIPHQRRM